MGASWRILGRSWGGPGASRALLGRPRGDTHAHLQRPEHTCTHMLRTRLSWVSLGLCVCGLGCAPGCVCEPPGLRLPMFQEACACVASAVFGRSWAPKEGQGGPNREGGRRHSRAGWPPLETFCESFFEIFEIFQRCSRGTYNTPCCAWGGGSRTPCGRNTAAPGEARHGVL